MNEITTVGIDLAKHVFAVHAVARDGRVVLRRIVSRSKLLETVAQLPRSLIGLEACSGAHEWARRLQSLGHTVRLMAPAFVSPYRKSGKNDGNDAEAICEAVSRPNMRFVSIKSVDQQAVLTLHRVRQGFVVERTAVVNRIRGLLAEFGVVLPQRVESVRRGLHESTAGLPDLACRAIRDLQAHLHGLDERIDRYDRELKHLARAATLTSALYVLFEMELMCCRRAAR
jgi:transposase